MSPPCWLVLAQFKKEEETRLILLLQCHDCKLFLLQIFTLFQQAMFASNKLEAIDCVLSSMTRISCTEQFRTMTLCSDDYLGNPIVKLQLLL